MTACPFCVIAPDKIIAQISFTFTIRDTLAVSPGHMLIIPKRHIAEDVRSSLLALAIPDQAFL